MNRLTGKYTTRRTGIAYSYEAKWVLAGTKLSWSANMVRDADGCEVIAGETTIHGKLHIARAVRTFIERKLDYRRNRSARLRFGTKPVKLEPLG